MAQMAKESTCNMGNLGSIPRLGRSPGGGHDNSLQHSCLENPHGQRSLVGYSPWGLKELDTTEQLSIAPHIFFICQCVYFYTEQPFSLLPCFFLIWHFSVSSFQMQKAIFYLLRQSNSVLCNFHPDLGLLKSYNDLW